jgi:ABC-2 type transport system ATP-binding protein
MTSALTAPSAGAISIDGDRIDRNLTGVKRRLWGCATVFKPRKRAFRAAKPRISRQTLRASAAEAAARSEELLEFAGLNGRKTDKAKTFSGGMRRKLMIVKALMHEPDILLLDEQSVGFDASWRRRIS